MQRVTSYLDESEAKALLKMAEGECRDPGAQLRWLLIQEAVHRGLLAPQANDKTESQIATGERSHHNIARSIENGNA